MGEELATSSPHLRARVPIVTHNTRKDQMAEERGPLPEFGKPPVSEVALSVEFEPLANWRSPHAGLYWGRINSEYPHTEAKLPVPSQIENFDAEFRQGPTVRVEMVDPDLSRFWFLAEPPNRLIQVQRDRFIINWRKVRGDEVYPRYEVEMRPRLEREWAGFQKFVAEHGIGGITVRQCEITYVNDIPRGGDWDTVPEALALFAPWWGRGSSGFLPLPEMLSVTGSFEVPAKRGRLHFAALHAQRQFDQREVIQLRLTARGEPESDDAAGVLSWMDLGREWIVRGFADLTSPKAHALWERTR